MESDKEDIIPLVDPNDSSTHSPGSSVRSMCNSSARCLINDLSSSEFPSSTSDSSSKSRNRYSLEKRRQRESDLEESAESIQPYSTTCSEKISKSVITESESLMFNLSSDNVPDNKEAPKVPKVAKDDQGSEHVLSTVDADLTETPDKGSGKLKDGVKVQAKQQEEKQQQQDVSSKSEARAQPQNDTTFQVKGQPEQSARSQANGQPESSTKSTADEKEVYAKSEPSEQQRLDSRAKEQDAKSEADEQAGNTSPATEQQNAKSGEKRRKKSPTSEQSAKTQAKGKQSAKSGAKERQSAKTTVKGRKGAKSQVDEQPLNGSPQTSSLSQTQQPTSRRAVDTSTAAINRPALTGAATTENTTQPVDMKIPSVSSFNTSESMALILGAIEHHQTEVMSEKVQTLRDRIRHRDHCIRILEDNRKTLEQNYDKKIQMLEERIQMLEANLKDHGISITDLDRSAGTSRSSRERSLHGGLTRSRFSHSKKRRKFKRPSCFGSKEDSD